MQCWSRLVPVRYLSQMDQWWCGVVQVMVALWFMV